MCAHIYSCIVCVIENSCKLKDARQEIANEFLILLHKRLVLLEDFECFNLLVYKIKLMIPEHRASRIVICCHIKSVAKTISSKRIIYMKDCL